MRFRKLPLCCECGRCPHRITDVGFTSAHELVLRWWCTGCKRAVYTVRSLSDCWRYCPEPERCEHVEETGRFAFGPEDTRFLHSLGVTLVADEVGPQRIGA